LLPSEKVWSNIRVSAMKVLVILALCCSALAMPERTPRDIQAAMRDSCPGRCVMQDKYREWVMQAAPKVKEFAKQLAETNQQPIVPTLHPEKWDTYCTEIESVRTCINACNDPADAEKKTKALAILTAGHDIVCDQEIKTKFPCLQEVAAVPSPTCNTQCSQFQQPIMDAYNQYKTGQMPAESERWERAKTIAKNACSLVNCRLKCRKDEIVTKCHAEGLSAAKKLLKEFAILGQTAHSQFRPAANFPDECKPDAVIAGV
jgi:hypothetical protein